MNKEKNSQSSFGMDYVRYIDGVRRDFMENLTSSAAPVDVLGKAVGSLKSVVSADAGFVYLYDSLSEIYKRIMISGSDSNGSVKVIPQSLPTHAGTGNRLDFHTQMLFGEPCICCDSESDEICPELLQIFKNAVGLALFPMKMADRLIGITGFISVTGPLCGDSRDFLADMCSAFGIYVEANADELFMDQGTDCTTDDTRIISIDGLGTVLDIGSELTEALSWIGLDAKGYHILDLIKPKFHRRITEEFFEALSGKRNEIIVPLNISERIQLFKVHPVIVDQQDMKRIEFYGRKVRSIGE